MQRSCADISCAKPKHFFPSPSEKAMKILFHSLPIWWTPMNTWLVLYILNLEQVWCIVGTTFVSILPGFACYFILKQKVEKFRETLAGHLKSSGGPHAGCGLDSTDLKFERTPIRTRNANISFWLVPAAILVHLLQTNSSEFLMVFCRAGEISD